MAQAIRALDELLRGERTRSEHLRLGLQNIPLRVFVPLAIGLGATYGFFMGWYATSAAGHTDAWKQLIASSVKLPALFICTLLVTFPSLYVFNALVGARLRFLATIRLLVAAIVINLAVGASLGPILGFFTLSTSSYHFMVVLNVGLLGAAGMIGLWFLLGTLRRLTQIAVLDSNEAAATEGEEVESRSEQISSANAIFTIWMVIYALVGAQMGWLLRPFIGHPGMAFEWFRPKEGSFFGALSHSLQQLMGS
jgi:hypothetical protein